MVVVRLYSSFLQTQQVHFIPEQSSILVSPDHMTRSHASSGSSRWSTADFRSVDVCRLQRGDLRGFNPWRCSALLMATFETVVPALFTSSSRSSPVVLVWFLTFLITIGSLWGESLHDSPDWGFLKTSEQSVRLEFLLVARWSNTYFVQ